MVWVCAIFFKLACLFRTLLPLLFFPSLISFPDESRSLYHYMHYRIMPRALNPRYCGQFVSYPLPTVLPMREIDTGLIMLLTSSFPDGQDISRQPSFENAQENINLPHCGGRSRFPRVYMFILCLGTEILFV